MRHPQVLVYESDGRLAELLRRDSKAHGWLVREPRGIDSCLRLLARGGPQALVLKMGKDLVREATLLERVMWLFPDTASFVVSDADDARLAALSWDLGASFVVSPALQRQGLRDLVASFLNVEKMKEPSLSRAHRASAAPDAETGGLPDRDDRGD
jgi:DNA-binding NtrC family response regulator